MTHRSLSDLISRSWLRGLDGFERPPAPDGWRWTTPPIGASAHLEAEINGWTMVVLPWIGRDAPYGVGWHWGFHVDNGSAEGWSHGWTFGLDGAVERATVAAHERQS